MYTDYNIGSRATKIFWSVLKYEQDVTRIKFLYCYIHNCNC